ncbi:Palmitoyl-protein thioesterase 1 [Plasmodiophora brassicae]
MGTWHAVIPLVVLLGVAAVCDAAAAYRPVVFMHGLGDSSAHLEGLVSGLQRRYPGMYAWAVPVCNGRSSMTTTMSDQVQAFTRAVQENHRLTNGFNLVGLSQGALVARAYVEMYNVPRVHRLISVVGPQEGVDGCPKTVPRFLCDLFEADPYDAPVAISGYWKDVNNKDEYLVKSPFLADINNERPTKNAQYADNMRSLDMYVLVQAANDTVVTPKASEHHGFWAWNNARTVVPLRQSPGYRGDWIGLKSLDRQGKIAFLQFQGDHVDVVRVGFWDDRIVPLLDDPIPIVQGDGHSSAME